MPPLYRMPIAYLVAALIAIGVVVAMPRDRDDTRKDAARQPIEDDTPGKPVEVPEPKPEPTDGILRTDEGLRRKVLVTSLGLVCRDEPKGGVEVGRPLDYFSIKYLFGESDESDPPTFQIGPRGGPPLGWVSSRAVLEWDTRLMARPTSKPDRPPLVIYSEEPCARAAATGQACQKHAKGRCPTEGADEPSKSSAEAAKRPLGLPILKSESVPGPDGKARTLFEVASLVRDRAPPPRPKTLPDDLRAAIKQVNITLCIDTTSSMQPSIDAARRVAEKLVADAQDRYRDVTLRLAIIEYRDQSPAFVYPYRIATSFTDPAGFRAALDKLKAAKHGDNSVDEGVLDGVAAALPLDLKEPDELPHLDWPLGRAGELASKLIVLIGDAPDHARDLDRAQALAARARRAGITIAAVTIDRGDDLSRDERVRYLAQWDALADGSAHPRDAAGKVADAVMIPLAQAAQLAPRLQSLIDDRVERARDLAALAAAEAEGRLKEYVNSRGLSLDKVAPVLDDLHAGEARDRDEARPDPRLDGVRAPSVRRGWIAEKVGGVPLVTLEVLMSKAELDALIGELLQLQQAAQGTARDLADLLRIGTAAASGETAFLAADRGSLTFADYLRRRQGLPPARPDSLLRRTQADLLQADDLDRSALDAKLRSSIAGLVQLRDSWSDPLLTADGLAPVPYDLIDF